MALEPDFDDSFMLDLEAPLPKVTDEMEDESILEQPAQVQEPEPELEQEQEEDMDLSSSRSSSPASGREPSVVAEEPSIVGAYPDSPARASASPEPSFAPCPNLREIIVISDDDGSAVSPHVSVSPDSEAGEQEAGGAEGSVREEMQAQALDVLYGLPESFCEAQTPASASVEREQDHIQITELNLRCMHAPPDTRALESQIAATNVSIHLMASPHGYTHLLQRELEALRDAHDRNEVTFVADVLMARARIDALDASVGTAHAGLAAHDAALHSAQSRLQSLGSIMADLQRRTALAEGLEELAQEVGAAKDMLKGGYMPVII